MHIWASSTPSELERVASLYYLPYSLTCCVFHLERNAQKRSWPPHAILSQKSTWLTCDQHIVKKPTEALAKDGPNSPPPILLTSERVYGLAFVFVLSENSDEHDYSQIQKDRRFESLSDSSVDFSGIFRNANFWPILDWNPMVKNEERGSPYLSSNGRKGTRFHNFSKQHGLVRVSLPCHNFGFRSISCF